MTRSRAVQSSVLADLAIAIDQSLAGALICRLLVIIRKLVISVDRK